MPYFHEYDWLFALGTIFCALDAYNIGANDVANSFATSVASKSLTMRQACMAAALMEFLGAVLVGAKVAGTIKNGIISLSVFNKNAGVELLAFTVALSVSATWLMICTRLSWPVSTTYSIVSALAGVGVAVGGKDAVQWGWNGGKGLGTIFAGFIIAPSIAAGFGAIIFLFTKFVVLRRKDSLRAALMASPLYFFTAAAICTMTIVYKGAPSLGLDKLSESTIAAAIVGTAAVIAVLSTIFWLPYVYSKTVKKDYTLRWYHFFMGPLLWKREAPADAGAKAHVPDYRVYKDEKVTQAPIPLGADSSSSTHDIEKKGDASDAEEIEAQVPRRDVPLSEVENKRTTSEEVPPLWWSPKTLKGYVMLAFKALTHGTSVNIHDMQANGESPKEAARIAEMHRSAVQYPSETEHAFSFLQVLTACTASFAHGSNDVANAIGPYAAIYAIWSTSQPSSSKTETPTWILVFGGAMIVVGLATYGYNIMRVLGNKMTLMSPSRGFSMELGAAVTVLLASNFALPVSTTMCITGSTLGVALCNGDLKAFNWRNLAWIVSGWIITVPVVGTLSGVIMGMLINAPKL